jgi:hypothetical protein
MMMRPVDPYEFRRGAGISILFAVAAFITLSVSLLDFMTGDTAFGVIFMALAIVNLINLVHALVTPFARLIDKRICFYISPALRRAVDLGEINGVETTSRYKIRIRQANGKARNVSLFGIEPMEKERLMLFLQGVVEMNKSLPASN